MLLLCKITSVKYEKLNTVLNALDKTSYVLSTYQKSNEYHLYGKVIKSLQAKIKKMSHIYEIEVSVYTYIWSKTACSFKKL